MSGPFVGAKDADCQNRPAVGVGATTAELVAAFSTDPAVTTKSAGTVGVGSQTGQVLDIQLSPTWTGTCGWGGGKPAALLAQSSLWDLVRYPNVYLKVTERKFVGARAGKATPEKFFGRLVADFGAARIAWGSNYPASERSLPDLLSLAQDTLAFLPDRDREWIFSLTAQALYPSLAGHSQSR